MKHVFTLLAWMLLVGGLVTSAPAQTSPFLPLPARPTPSARQSTTAPSARQAAAATIRYVKAGASGSGASWSNASGDLQAMINASASGDQVWIAGGTYKPSTTGLATARNAAFALKNGVSVLGGFTGASGSEGNLTTRTALPSSTTLSGDIGTVGDPSDNSYHVILNSGNSLDNSAVLDGVVISGGNANVGADINAFGGGMLNVTSSPRILNCVFSQNNATTGGGLDNAFTTNVSVTNCIFLNNTSTFTGGFYDQGATNTLLTNCFFAQNTASVSGAFRASGSTNVMLTNCTFSGNSSAIGTQENSTVTLVNCLLWNNGGSNAIGGGGITVSYSALETGVTGFADGGNNKPVDSSPFESATGPALKACAVAVDAGNNAANSTTTDVLGNTRKVRTIDIGAAEFQGTPTQPIAITQQPVSGSSVCAGSPVSVPVSVSGTSPSFQWYKDGQAVSGQTSATLTLNSAQVSQTGSYALVATSACNSVTSTAFSLTVNAPYSVNLTNNGPLTCVKNTVLLTTTGGPTGATYTYSSGAQASSASSTTATVSLSRPYSVTVTVPGGCSATAATIVSSNTITPSVSINPSSQTICQGQSASFIATGADSYTWSTGATTASISASASGAYSVTGTSSSNGCSATATANLTANALPTQYAVTGGGAYCAGSNGIGIGLSSSQTGVSYQLRRDGNPVGSPVDGTGSALSFGNQTTAGTYTVLATNPATSCQQAMSGSASVTITPLPDAPALVTASGYPYPAGQSNLTISQNVGPVSLTASGCSGGMLMANGNAASSLTITTTMTGTQTYTATCTSNGCTSPAASFQLTVVPTTLSVLHRDADYGNTGNNIIKPFLELANADGQAIPYGEVTVRYWFTSEGNAPPTNLAVYYAQLGAVNMNYVALSQPRQGALGYIEYSFPGGGSLGGGGNSGPIENGIQKTDGSNFDESDDYSYQANYQDYVPNMHITAYRNGVIFYGQEPTAVASQTAVQVYTQAKDGTTTSQIQTRLELRNTGNVALAVQDFRLRYYFTSDNNQTASVYVDYADIGASNIQARVIKLPAPVGGADSYVELRTVPTSLSLAPMSSLGAIDFRLVRSDYGLFDQTNDYSYAANYGNEGLNNRVTVLLNNRLIFGTPPSGAPARIGVTEESTSDLQVRVLGNPVAGSHAAVEISGAYAQPVQLRLVDLQGRTLHEQRIEQAGSLERVLVPMGSSQGLLLLKVSTPTQQQQVKLLRP